jgi:oligopeptidase B
MIFDTEQNGKSFDIVVKDLNSGQLLPVLILNALDEVAFDHHQGFYYTQVDADGRGKRVYRHQIGTLQKQDVLIYEETNADFHVLAENTGSKEFVSINILSTFEPKTNEIWLRNAKEEKEKFWLVQPM